MEFKIEKEFLALETLKDRTTGLDLFRAFENVICEFKMDPTQLISICTEGAKAMTGVNNGFIGLLKKDEKYKSVLAFHCIIHQQALCSKKTKFVQEHIFEKAINVFNSIRYSPTSHRSFKNIVKI